MLHTPLWKRILIWSLVAAGVLLTAPNLFYAQVERHNDAARAVEETGFATTEQQAALVMHHHFEHDREALEALAHTRIPFIGLLGPVRRREDLLRVLPAPTHALLVPRLRSPVGLRLGGQGPEAIALSIAAQLQAWRYGETP